LVSLLELSCMEKRVQFATVSGVMLLLLGGGAIYAQPRPDPQRGHELASRVCKACHVIDRETSSSIQADVPSFAVIASRPWVNAEYVAARIMNPHPQMPGIPLTTQEIRDVTAYILSLKRND
jgi:mono/diheme cytochrome c family protein